MYTIKSLDISNIVCVRKSFLKIQIIIHVVSGQAKYELILVYKLINYD